MAKCCQVNQHCSAPANGPGQARSSCFACGEPVCTAPGCSIRVEHYLNHGRQRICENCLTQRFGDPCSGCSGGLLRLYQQWAEESGYPGEQGAVYVQDFMKPHRERLAEEVLVQTRTGEKVAKGRSLYGSCGGRFSGLTRSDGAVKRVIAVGRDWCVVRGNEGPEFFHGDLRKLVPYLLPKRKAVIPTSLGAIYLERVENGRSGVFWRGNDEDGDQFEVYP